MMKKGFTLLEMIIVIGVLSIVGVIILTIFTRTLKGNNKAQILIAMKQNGQSVLENMVQVVRNAEYVICVSNSGSTLVVVQNGKYTRYQFIPSTITTNGYIEEDFPVEVPTCDALNDVLINPQILTDTSPQKGVSVESGLFTRTKVSGSKDSLTIKFNLLPGKSAPSALVGQISPVTFETTIQLR